MIATMENLAREISPALEKYLEARLALVVEMIRAQTATHNIALASAEKAVAAAMAASDRAITKSELAADKRFESVNEFRKLVDDQQKTLMSRSECLSMNASILQKLSELDAQHRMAMGRQESLAMHSATGEKLTDLKVQVDALISERRGITGGWGYAVGVVGFVIAIGSLIVMSVKFLQP